MSREVDLAHGILDHQLLDSDERRCGKVDDLELEGLGEGRPHVAELLAGPPAWRGRGLLGRLAAGVARGRICHVAWGEVTEVEAAVRLRKPARDLGLGRGDDRARRLVAWIPGAE
jgi:hypothetical protein